MNAGWLDRALSFEDAHFLSGFPQPDGRFHFKPDWAGIGPLHERLPTLPVAQRTGERAAHLLDDRYQHFFIEIVIDQKDTRKTNK